MPYPVRPARRGRPRRHHRRSTQLPNPQLPNPKEAPTTIPPEHPTSVTHHRPPAHRLLTNRPLTHCAAWATPCPPSW